MNALTATARRGSIPGDVRERPATEEPLHRGARSLLEGLLSQLSEDGISHLSDNVILLQFVPRNAQLRRAVTVLKTRASRHDPDIREFTITPKGIVLDEPHSDATR